MVTKLHKWRGKFPRIACITSQGFSTQDLNFALTNHWDWDGDFVDAKVNPGEEEFRCARDGCAPAHTYIDSHVAAAGPGAGVPPGHHAQQTAALAGKLFSPASFPLAPQRHGVMTCKRDL